MLRSRIIFDRQHSSLGAHISIEAVGAESVWMIKGPSSKIVFIMDGLDQILDGVQQLAAEKQSSIIGGRRLSKLWSIKNVVIAEKA